MTQIARGAFIGCEGLTDVYFAGTEEQWNGIIMGEGNESLTSTNIFFNSTGPEPGKNLYDSFPDAIKYVPYSYFYRPNQVVNVESAPGPHNWTDFCNVNFVFSPSVADVTPYIDGERASLWKKYSDAQSAIETQIGIPAEVFQEHGEDSHQIVFDAALRNGTIKRYTVDYSVSIDHSLTPRYYIEGVLPGGLTMNSESGELYGVPMAEGTWSFTLGAEYLDAAGNVASAMENPQTLFVENNTNSAVQRPNDYEIIVPVGTPDPGDVNHFFKNDYLDETLVIDAPFHEFRRLYIDGVELTWDVDYTAREGSTVLTIRAQTFRNFGEGTHTIAAEFRVGTGSGSTMKRVAQNYTLTISTGSPSRPTKSPSGTRQPVHPVSQPSQSPSTPPPAPELPVTDVSESDWFYEDVVWAYQNGIMLGVDAVSFAPQVEISEATVVTVLARLAGADLSQFEGVQEEGIDPGQHFTASAVWAMRAGLLPDRKAFTGTGTATREQMAVLLVNYLRSVGADTAPPAEPAVFADGAQMSEAGNAAFQVLYQKGIFKGTGGMQMNPAGTTKRAHFVALVHRIDQAAE